MTHQQKYPVPKVGDKFDRWTVLSIPENASTQTKIPCRCTCGNTGTPRADSLMCGGSRGCRVCRNRQCQEAMHTANLKYGFVPEDHRLRLQRRISGAIERCRNPKKIGYARYGGRGIGVHPAWRKDYTLFARYLMTLPGWDDPNLTIDRIDNDGNYEPGNLRFVTLAENNRNRPQYKRRGN